MRPRACPRARHEGRLTRMMNNTRPRMTTELRLQQPHSIVIRKLIHPAVKIIALE